MPLIIYRQPLADKGDKTEHARYSDITLYIGNKLIERAASEEAKRRKDVKHISVSETKPDANGQIIHRATLVGHRAESLVEYYGEWPLDQENPDAEDNAS